MARDQAMSMEAGRRRHISSLPPNRDAGSLHVERPNYISPVVDHPTARLMLVGCVVWMSMGIMVMKKK